MMSRFYELYAFVSGPYFDENFTLFFSFAHLNNKKQKNIILNFRNQFKNQLFVADKRDVFGKGLRQSWKLGKTEAANLIKDLLWNTIQHQILLIKVGVDMGVNKDGGG